MTWNLYLLARFELEVVHPFSNFWRRPSQIWYSVALRPNPQRQSAGESLVNRLNRLNTYYEPRRSLCWAAYRLSTLTLDNDYWLLTSCVRCETLLYAVSCKKLSYVLWASGLLKGTAWARSDWASTRHWDSGTPTFHLHHLHRHPTKKPLNGNWAKTNEGGHIANTKNRKQKQTQIQRP